MSEVNPPRLYDDTRLALNAAHIDSLVEMYNPGEAKARFTPWLITPSRDVIMHGSVAPDEGRRVLEVVRRLPYEHMFPRVISHSFVVVTNRDTYLREVRVTARSSLFKPVNSDDPAFLAKHSPGKVFMHSDVFWIGMVVDGVMDELVGAKRLTRKNFSEFGNWFLRRRVADLGVRPSS